MILTYSRQSGAKRPALPKEPIHEGVGTNIETGSLGSPPERMVDSSNPATRVSHQPDKSCGWSGKELNEHRGSMVASYDSAMEKWVHKKKSTTEHFRTSKNTVLYI